MSSQFSDKRQSILREQGHLAELEHFQGLYRIKLLPPVQAGEWKLQAKSDDHITFTVIGKQKIKETKNPISISCFNMTGSERSV